MIDLEDIYIYIISSCSYFHFISNNYYNYENLKKFRHITFRK